MRIVPRRALISLSDKTHLDTLAQTLHYAGVELVATKSTADAIVALGLPVTRVEDMFGFPEILGGRVKTLQAPLMGGILARVPHEGDEKDVAAHNIPLFDVVVCNLYPFEETLAKTRKWDALVEKVDIGGVTLLRAAAKNATRVTVLSKPAQYEGFLKEVSEGGTTTAFRLECARQAFSLTALYDSQIASALNFELDVHEPEELVIPYRKSKVLRYGENPHQKAALYAQLGAQSAERPDASWTQAKWLQGKEPSYNNLLDLEHGQRIVDEFALPACVIIKHNMPCGVSATAEGPQMAWRKALEHDRVSPFGGVVFFNRPVTLDLALELGDIFLEVVAAPAFSPEASEHLGKKKNLRLVEIPSGGNRLRRKMLSPLMGGALLQDFDAGIWEASALKVVSGEAPSGAVLQAYELGMTVAKHVRSNAIVLANSEQTLAIAGGFTNRVDAVAHALKRHPKIPFGAVLASDGFFPFADNIEVAAQHGVTHIIQPGGSVRDEEVIQAAQKHGISMVFTGVRHFKH